MSSPALFMIATCVAFAGCAGLSKEQYLVCPYDAVWEAAVEAMKNRPLTVKDKETGVLETGWTEMAAPERRFGLFQRDAFDNKERASMTVTVKRLDEVTQVSVTERRETWHAKGGVSSQATRWWPIEPSQEAMGGTINRINTKVKEQGCHPS